ncbi:FG-GAP and VCBS repeat-containing protein [Streptomyces sp. Ru87]|uniref:FG-GAP and VCBS repeat-containing protein n=1 Tax=Streptomyces sp. Ru87 TaxID=2044307 RepID=UPI00211D1CF7|nr:FG-GAP and VCBS repeat-containing protein [Streptomyces sp. Ru87]
MHRLPPTLLTARCAIVAALITVPALPAASAASAAPGDYPSGPRSAGAAAPDFDGDGHADTVTAAPGGTVAGQENAGYLTVVHGSGPGADVTRHKLLHQELGGVPGQAAPGARFGGRTVARDLDGDGRTDLAVRGAGGSSAMILWGSAEGLAEGTELPEAAGTDGENLIGGDFNGDGHADLVGGSTVSEEWGDLRVLYGPFGRDGSPAATGDLATPHVYEPRDLVSGDVTGDGKDDLVSLHDFEEMSERTNFWRGTADGLEADEDTLQGADTATVGDVDGDGYGDIVMRTVPGGVVENLPYDEGTLKVVYGSADGPSTRTAVIDQDTAGVPGTSEDGDQLGASLAAGDVNGDGFADIAAGVPYEDIDGAGADAGAVVLLKGSADGLTGRGAQAFHQNTAGVPGTGERGDAFGTGLALLDTDGDGRDDLAAGAPGEDGDTRDPGAGWVLRGSGGGLTTDGVVSYGPNAFPGAPRAGARLGESYPR